MSLRPQSEPCMVQASTGEALMTCTAYQSNLHSFFHARHGLEERATTGLSGHLANSNNPGGGNITQGRLIAATRVVFYKSETLPPGHTDQRQTPWRGYLGPSSAYRCSF